MIEYIEFLLEKHRATREVLINEGKTYRSRFVAQENGYINALNDIKNTLEQPQKDAELQEAMAKFAQRFKG